jgi:hypothetical protein
MPRIGARPPAAVPSTTPTERPAAPAAPSRAPSDGFAVGRTAPTTAPAARENLGSPVTRAISGTLSGMINGVVGFFDRGLPREPGPAHPVGRREPLDVKLDPDLPSWLGRLTRRLDRWTDTDHPRDLVVTFPKQGLQLKEPLTLSGSGIGSGGRNVAAEVEKSFKAAFKPEEAKALGELSQLKAAGKDLGARQGEYDALRTKLASLEQPLMQFKEPLTIHNPLMASGTNLAGMLKDLAVDVKLNGLKLSWDAAANAPVAVMDGEVVGRGGKKKGELRDLTQPFPLTALDTLRETLARTMVGTTEGVTVELQSLSVGKGDGKKLKLPTQTSDTTQLADATLGWLETMRPTMALKVKAPGASMDLQLSTVGGSQGKGQPLAEYEVKLDAAAATSALPGVLGLLSSGAATSANGTFKIKQFLSAGEVKVDYGDKGHFLDVRKEGRPWFTLDGGAQKVAVNEHGRVTSAHLKVKGYEIQVETLAGAKSPSPADPTVRYPVAKLTINGKEQELASFPSFDHIVRFLTVFDETAAAAQELGKALSLPEVKAALTSGTGLIDHFEAKRLPYEAALTRVMRGQLYLQELFDVYKPPRTLIDLRNPSAGEVKGEDVVAAAPKGLSFAVEGSLHGALVKSDGRHPPEIQHSYWNSLRSFLDKYPVDRLVDGQNRNDPYASAGLLSQPAKEFTAMRDPETMLSLGVSGAFAARGVKLKPDVAEKLFSNPQAGYDYLFRIDDGPGETDPDVYCTELVRVAMRDAGVKQPFTLPLEYELPGAGNNAITNAAFEAMGRDPKDPLVLRQRGVIAQCFILEALIPRNLDTQVPDAKGAPMLEIGRWLETKDAPMLKKMAQNLDTYVEHALENFARDEKVQFSPADIAALKAAARENLTRASGGYAPQ